jgi:hypothetical protein
MNNNNKRKKEDLSYQKNAFPRHPADWQDRPALDPVVVTAVQAAGHAEVGDLDAEVVSH